MEKSELGQESVPNGGTTVSICELFCFVLQQAPMPRSHRAVLDTNIDMTNAIMRSSVSTCM